MIPIAGAGPVAHYDVFGRGIAVSAASDRLSARVADSWQPFRVETPAVTHLEVSISSLPGVSRLTEWQFFSNGRILFIGDDRRLVTGSFYAPPWQVDIQAFGWTDEDAYYYLVEPILLTVLGRLGLLHCHAAAVCRRDQAVLIAGVSGSGKSTTTLSLLGAGFSFLADDDLFLEERNGRVEASSKDAFIYATDRTVTHVPALHQLLATPLVQRGHGLKRRVPVRTMFPAVSSASVSAVLFPRIEADAATSLRILAPGEAIARLLALQPKEYPTVVTDPDALQRRLDTHAALALSATCVDVVLGRDADDLPARVEALLG